MRRKAGGASRGFVLLNAATAKHHERHTIRKNEPCIVYCYRVEYSHVPTGTLHEILKQAGLK